MPRAETNVPLWSAHPWISCRHRLLLSQPFGARLQHRVGVGEVGSEELALSPAVPFVSQDLADVNLRLQLGSGYPFPILPTLSLPAPESDRGLEGDSERRPRAGDQDRG